MVFRIQKYSRRKQEQLVGGMGVGSGGPCPPWIFIRGTNTVDRGLKVLFFGVFLLFLGLFSVGPPGNFSADALGGRGHTKFARI